jgi:hypothetical protein
MSSRSHVSQFCGKALESKMLIIIYKARNYSTCSQLHFCFSLIMLILLEQDEIRLTQLIEMDVNSICTMRLSMCAFISLRFS